MGFCARNSPTLRFGTSSALRTTMSSRRPSGACGACYSGTRPRRPSRACGACAIVASALVACSSSSAGPSNDAGGGSPGADGGIGPTGGSVDGGDGVDSTPNASPDSATGMPAPTVGGIFEQPEPWTTDVSALAKDPRSDAIIAALVSSGGWGDGNRLDIDFSIPLFFADASTPRQTIVAQAGSTYC